jgi:hypothetical protein
MHDDLSQFSSQTLFSAIQIISFATYHNQLIIIPYYFDIYSLLDATSLLSFSRHGTSCSTCCFWSEKEGTHHGYHSSWSLSQWQMRLQTMQNSFLVAKRRKHALVLASCTKLVHLTCYNGLQMVFEVSEPLRIDWHFLTSSSFSSLLIISTQPNYKTLFSRSLSICQDSLLANTSVP